MVTVQISRTTLPGNGVHQWLSALAGCIVLYFEHWVDLQFRIQSLPMDLWSLVRFVGVCDLALGPGFSRSESWRVREANHRS